MDGKIKKSWKGLACAGLATLALMIGAKELRAQWPDCTIVCDKGDLNCDGSVNFLDYATFADDWLKTGEYLAGDTNGNNIVDYNDFAVI